MMFGEEFCYQNIFHVLVSRSSDKRGCNNNGYYATLATEKIEAQIGVLIPSQVSKSANGRVRNGSHVSGSGCDGSRNSSGVHIGLLNPTNAVRPLFAV